MLAPNSVVQDRYLIVNQIGQGGMGAVYQAIDQRLRSTVALKQMLVVGEQLDRAFAREAQLLANLRHSALPKVSDFFANEQGQFLVMEFIPGSDLGALLAQRTTPFPVEEVVRWAEKLLDALEYLHTQSPPVIHRDIKPQNLKLTPRGEIILLDFGLAKGMAPFQSQVSDTPSLFGYTPQYAPLEQIRGTGTDARSDLYALAATLYHLLTRQPPTDALARAEAVLNRQPDPLRPAQQINQAVPSDLSRLLHQALALDSSQRFGSAAAFRRALQTMHRTDATPAPIPSSNVVITRSPSLTLPEAATPQSPETARPVAAATPLSLPPPVQVADRTTTPQYRPEQRGGGMRRWLFGCGALLVVAVALGALFVLNTLRNAAPTSSSIESAIRATAIASDNAGSTERITPVPLNTTSSVAIPTDATPIALGDRINGTIRSFGARETYTFDAEPGQQIFVQTREYDPGMEQIDLLLVDETGQELVNQCLGCDNIGVQTLTRGGRYTLAVGDDTDPATGAYELQVYPVPPPASYDVQQDAQIERGSPDANAGMISSPGAQQRYTLTAEPNDLVFVQIVSYDVGMEQIDIALTDDNDQEVFDTCLGCGDPGTQTLTRGGRYTLTVGDDTVSASGAYALRLYSVPSPQQFEISPDTTIEQNVPGSGAGVIESAGAIDHYVFEVSPGQQVAVEISEYDAGMEQLDVKLIDADGQELFDACLGCGNPGVQTLSKGGTYTLAVGDDDDPSTGAYRIVLSTP